MDDRTADLLAALRAQPTSDRLSHRAADEIERLHKMAYLTIRLPRLRRRAAAVEGTQ